MNRRIFVVNRPQRPSNTPIRIQRSSNSTARRITGGAIPQPKKLAIIFNHMYYGNPSIPARYGSENDVINLRVSLSRYGFHVETYIDNTAAEILDILREAMSHGNSLGEIMAFDRFYSVETLWNSFLAESCPTLIGKPKLFIIQACRGNDHLEAAYLYTHTDTSSYPDWLGRSHQPCLNNAYFIPNSADMLIMYACAHGRAALRGPRGTLFINSICLVLNDNADNVNGVDLIDLATTVNRMVASFGDIYDGKQMSNYISTLRNFHALKRD